MKLFRKAMLAVITMVLAVVAIVVPANRTAVDANTTDDSKEKWSAIGTINGTSWNTDFPLAYNSATDRYELQIALTAGQEFKIRLNNSWSKSIGYGGNTGAGISTYLSNSGGNFKVKTTGNYILWVKDDNVANYGDNSYGFGIDKAAEVVYHTLTFYSIDGSVLDTKEVIEGSTFESKFDKVDGYYLEGWYTDSSLTTKLEKGTTIKADYNLYPNYVAVEDYTVYFNDNGTLGSTVYAYMWRDTTDGGNNASWPGVAIQKNEAGLWAVEIDASETYTKIIFNGGDGKPQTVNLDLTYEEVTYVLGEKDDEGKYQADAHVTPEVTASVAWQQGTLNDAAALRIVVVLAGLTTENVAYFAKEISIKTTHAGIADTQPVDVLFTGVVDLATGDAITGDLYAVLTYTNIPTGEYAIEVLFDGAVAATETATIA